jgi:hypothetical protein
VAGLDGQNLLGPAAGFPADDEEIMERFVRDLGKDPREFLRRDDHVPTAWPGFLDVTHWAGLDQPHYRRPIERPLDGCDRASLPIDPAGLCIYPLLDADRLQPVDR